MPQADGDPIKPFAIGVCKDIRPLLRANTLVTSLRRATSADTHSKRYIFAWAQPDARRRDIGSNAMSPVKVVDRESCATHLRKPEKQPVRDSLDQPVFRPIGPLARTKDISIGPTANSSFSVRRVKSRR
ncbi:ProQ/FINO family protein [Rhizobium sp. 2YAF20]|uniref:ProQ/FINO family protein n=1 Tax=Rhizobium sp. 2YAF20 TaxID=3233027 RepID=UPI003F9C3102